MWGFIEDSWVFDEYAVTFPGQVPSLFVQEKMLLKITDRHRWREALDFWGMNQHRAQSVGRIIGYYDDLVTGKQVNDKPRAAWQDIGRNHVPDDPNFVFDESSLLCDVCGKECCLDLHRANEGMNAV